MTNQANRPTRGEANSARAKVALTHTTILLGSRRRQREVFGPPAVALIIGAALAIDRLTAQNIPDSFARLMALLFGAWAGYSAWKHYRRVPVWTALDVALVVAGGLLVIGALALLATPGIRLPWAVLLAVFSLAYIVQTADLS
jgi:hypothetical protein